MVQIITEYYILSEDEFGNFLNNIHVGDYVKIKTYDREFKCFIREIAKEEIVVENDDYEEFTINILDILEIHELY